MGRKHAEEDAEGGQTRYVADATSFNQIPGFDIKIGSSTSELDAEPNVTASQVGAGAEPVAQPN